MNPQNQLLSEQMFQGTSLLLDPPIAKTKEPKMAYSRDAFIETRERERLEREGLLIEYRKTGKRQNMEL